MTPKIRLTLDDGQVLYVEISESTAKKLAKRLYETVGLKGIAKWRKDDYCIEEFKIKEIIDFEEKTLIDAFSDLKSTIGKYWDRIEDVQSYLQNIRYKNG